ncbi:hypothetical protein [Kribbella sp. NPDC048928]|uniref:hypothetical protein n=1 Tax=Kribbella sp. NPDC048928 TaxID=3364111 RepID=UPI003722CFDB
MNAVRAELDKLRTLPITALSFAGTMLVAVLITIAQVKAGQVVDVVPYVQVGLVLIGVLPSTHEYAGRQLRTSLIAVPRRVRLVGAKTIAALIAGVLAAVLSLGATAITQYAFGNTLDVRGLAGAGTYLVLIALLAHAAGLLLHHLIPALVSMLCLVVLISPVVAAATDAARWLPDRAAAQLYNPTDAVLTATTGALISVVWILVVGALGAARFTRTDA